MLVCVIHISDIVQKIAHYILGILNLKHSAEGFALWP